MDNIAGVFLVQLLQQLPLLLAYAGAIFLGLTYWRRYPTAALLTAAAGGLLLTVAALQTFFNLYLIHNRTGADGSVARMGSLLTAIGIGCSLLRALSFGLLLAAVFYRRSDSQAAPADQS